MSPVTATQRRVVRRCHRVDAHEERVGKRPRERLEEHALRRTPGRAPGWDAAG